MEKIYLSKENVFKYIITKSWNFQDFSLNKSKSKEKASMEGHRQDLLFIFRRYAYGDAYERILQWLLAWIKGCLERTL